MIVHVLGSMTAGGNERLCLELIRRAPSGVEQALITINPTSDGPLSDLFRSLSNLRIFHEPYSRDMRGSFVAKLARRLRSLNPQGLVVYPFGLHLLVGLAARAVPGCRVIVHAGNPPASDGQRRNLFAWIVRGSRLLGVPIWCCSESVFAKFSALGVKLPQGSRAIPNGIDIPTLRAQAGEGTPARTERGPILAMVGRFDKIKDHRTLISAFRRVLETFPSAKLWLAGTGDLEAQLKHVAAVELKEEGSVSFLGVLQDVGRLLGQVDLFVFSTTADEGFGIALAEAMAVGLPIVASDVPACREVLADGACGELVRPGDVEAMSEGIVNLLADRGRQQALGQAAAERAAREYGIDTCARHYYDHLLRR